MYIEQEGDIKIIVNRFPYVKYISDEACNN